MHPVRPLLLLVMLFGAYPLVAQRYSTEVFSTSQVAVAPDVVYGLNIDPINSDLSDQGAILGELLQLQYFIDNGIPVPFIFFAPEDPNTLVKLVEPRMDIYAPDDLIDCEEERPLFIYLHTGDGLPPPLNGGPVGTRKDSSAVEICTRMARRGYVAASLGYRPGWDATNADPVIRRGSWINALYRGVHDLKQGIRALKASAPLYKLDLGKVIVCGEGMGGHIALAAATLDDLTELFIPSFLPDVSEPEVSFIDTTLAGDIEGFNGLMNLYRPNGYTSDFHFCASTGGALVDTSWMTPGDMPIVPFHPVFDPYVPYANGSLRDRLSGTPILPVHGPRLVQAAANAFGNNASFTGLPGGDPFTDRARDLYGTSVQHTGSSVPIGDQAEGLFPFVTPDWPAGDPALEEESHPWSWWDPQAPLALVEVAPGITAHEAGLVGNPDMSMEKGRAYIDTIMGYLNPRILVALGLSEVFIAEGQPCDDGNALTFGDVYTAECLCQGVVDGFGENPAGAGLRLGPIPVQDRLNVSSEVAPVQSYELVDMVGRTVRSAVVNAHRFTVEREGLHTGPYVLRVRFAHGSAARKVALD